MLRDARREPLGVLAAQVLILLIVLAAGARLIAPFDATASAADALGVGPSGVHWLGTDVYGRDVWSRLLFGARVSLLIGFASSLLGVVVGAAFGLWGGYRGGLWDTIVERSMETVFAFPMLLLALVMVSALGPSEKNVIIALAVPIVPRAARIERSGVVVVKRRQFVEAARSIGCSDLRIMVRHVLPSTLASLLIIATAYVGIVIIQEAALDYLGMGIHEPQASWGLMLSGSATAVVTATPWVVIAPGVAIAVTVLAANLLGDSLRNLLDPQVRGG
jgi:peptide/nickel transport system permease protein